MMCNLKFLLIYSSNKITADNNNEIRANNKIHVISTIGGTSHNNCNNLQYFNQNNKIEMKNVHNKWKC